jgi:hypothetical protein
MQGRPDQGNGSWDRERATAARLAALKGTRETLQGTGKYRAISSATGKHGAISSATGKYGAIPQRPPYMPPHMDSRPETISRAPRPQHQTRQPRKMHPLIIILGAFVAIITIIAFVLVFLLVGAINQNTGPAATSVDFLSSLSSKNYDNAYQDLGPAVTIRLNRQDFTQQAQALDQQYGAITDYSEVPNSAIVKNNTRSFTYTITRKNLSKPYKLTITLQQDQNDNNNWKIVDYGTTLGPTQS